MNKITNKDLLYYLNYIGIYKDENNNRIIAGLETYINYEGIEITKVMHIIIYNTVTKALIYKAGNNLRMNIENITEYAENILIIVFKYLDNTFYLNKFLDEFFYDCRFYRTKTLAKNIIRNKEEEIENINTYKAREEVEKLEKSFKNECNKKGVLVVDGYSEYILIYKKDYLKYQKNKNMLKALLEEVYNKNIYKYKDMQGIEIEKLKYSNGNTLQCSKENINLLKKYINNIRQIA